MSTPLTHLKTQGRQVFCLSPEPHAPMLAKCPGLFRASPALGLNPDEEQVSEVTVQPPVPLILSRDTHPAFCTCLVCHWPSASVQAGVYPCLGGPGAKCRSHSQGPPDASSLRSPQHQLPDVPSPQPSESATLWPPQWPGPASNCQVGASGQRFLQATVDGVARQGRSSEERPAHHLSGQ